MILFDEELAFSEEQDHYRNINNTKTKKRYTKEEAIYGSFYLSSDSDSDSSRRRLNRREKRSKCSVSFVSAGYNAQSTEEKRNNEIISELYGKKQPFSANIVNYGDSSDESSGFGSDSSLEFDASTNYQRISVKSKPASSKPEVERVEAKHDEAATISTGKMEKLYGKGYAMLKKMGYSGKGLGKDESGITNPLKVNIRRKNKGLDVNDNSKSYFNISETDKSDVSFLSEIDKLLNLASKSEDILNEEELKENYVKFSVTSNPSDLYHLDPHAQDQPPSLKFAERYSNHIFPTESPQPEVDSKEYNDILTTAQIELMRIKQLPLVVAIQRVLSESQEINEKVLLRRAALLKYIEPELKKEEEVLDVSLEEAFQIVNDKFKSFYTDYSKNIYIHLKLPSLANKIGLQILEYFDKKSTPATTDLFYVPTILTKFRDDCFPFCTNDEDVIRLRHDWHTIIESRVLKALKSKLATFSIKPSKQDVEPIQSIFQWTGLLSDDTIADLLSSEFFPKWNNALKIWLKNPSVDLTEIHSWYQGWRSLFPESTKLHPKIESGFTEGLQTLEQYLDLIESIYEFQELEDLEITTSVKTASSSGSKASFSKASERLSKAKSHVKSPPLPPVPQPPPPPSPDSEEKEDSIYSFVESNSKLPSVSYGRDSAKSEVKSKVVSPPTIKKETTKDRVDKQCDKDVWTLKNPLLNKKIKDNSKQIEFFKRQAELNFQRHEKIIDQPDVESKVLTPQMLINLSEPNKASENTEKSFLRRPSVACADLGSRLGHENVRIVDVLEEIAASNNFLMIPKVGKSHNGKQIYKFGHLSVYIDSGVIYCYVSSSSTWEAIDPEKLVGLLLKFQKRQ